MTTARHQQCSLFRTSLPCSKKAKGIKSPTFTARARHPIRSLLDILRHLYKSGTIWNPFSEMVSIVVFLVIQAPSRTVSIRQTIGFYALKTSCPSLSQRSICAATGYRGTLLPKCQKTRLPVEEVATRSPATPTA